MTTTADIVGRAFRKIGVKAEDEELTADQVQNGVDNLNMMLAAWRLQGVDLDVGELAPASAFPLDMEFQEGTVYLLASRLAPDYALPVGFDADAWFRTIQARYMEIEEAQMPLAMRRTTSQRRIF